MLCFRDELGEGDKCAKKFDTAAIGDTGELMDEDESGDNTKEWKKTIRFLYDKDKEDGKCSLHNAGSSVSRLARDKCAPMKQYKKCWNDKYNKWDTTDMTDEEKHIDYNGDGKVSDKEKERAQKTWILKEMHKKLQTTIRGKMEDLNIAQTEESFAEPEPEADLAN